MSTSSTDSRPPVWQIPCALAPNFGTIIVCRLLGGISSAGGSVTLGMIADMWTPEEQQFAVAFIVFSSVGGSVLGPIFGGIIETHYNWHWNFWIQLIVGVAVQAVHFFLVPETCTKVLLDREAKRRRNAGEDNVWGPSEVEKNRFAPRKILTIWLRPVSAAYCSSCRVQFADCICAVLHVHLRAHRPLPVAPQWLQ